MYVCVCVRERLRDCICAGMCVCVCVCVCAGVRSVPFFLESEGCAGSQCDLQNAGAMRVRAVGWN